MGAGRQHPGDPGRAGEIPVHDPDAVSGEQVRMAFQGLVQQLLLSFSLVPPAAGRGTGRAAGHRQGGAGGCVAEPQLPQLGIRGGIIRGAGRPERLPVRRGIGDPGQRPVDRAHVQVPDGDGPVIVIAVLGVDAGQQQVPQLLQRDGPERISPGGGHRRGRQLVRPLPRHAGQVPEQGCHHPGVVRIRRHQRHQQDEPDRQRGRHRPPRGPLHLAAQHRRRGDLADHARPAGQGVQPLLGHAEADVIRRMPLSLHPPVAAHHRRRDRHRLAEHHHIPGADLPRPRHYQRRTAALPQPRPGRPRHVRHPDRDHSRLPGQARRGISGAGGRDIRQRDRVKGHEEAPARNRLLVTSSSTGSLPPIPASAPARRGTAAQPASKGIRHAARQRSQSVTGTGESKRCATAGSSAAITLFYMALRLPCQGTLQRSASTR